MIELISATKLYGSVIGVNDITLNLAPGAYGLLGPNGSGKTTLAEALLYFTGATNRMGRVEDGTTVADWDAELLESAHREAMRVARDIVQGRFWPPTQPPTRRGWWSAGARRCPRRQAWRGWAAGPPRSCAPSCGSRRRRSPGPGPARWLFPAPAAWRPRGALPSRPRAEGRRRAPAGGCGSSFVGRSPAWVRLGFLPLAPPCGGAPGAGEVDDSGEASRFLSAGSSPRRQ